MSFLVDVVFVADVACSLLWGKDTIGSMPGSHLVSYQVEKLLADFYYEAVLSAKKYSFVL